MNSRLLLPALAASLLAFTACSTPPAQPTAAKADITVEFANPDKFRDATDSLGGHLDDNALESLRSCLKEKASARLAPGQKLSVTFTDVDLAGEFQPGARFDRVRLIKTIYFPRLEFTFTLADASGQTLKQGTRTLSDMDFMSNAGRIGSDQPYYYDKVLLEEWLKKEFPPAAR